VALRIFHIRCRQRTSCSSLLPSTGDARISLCGGDTKDTTRTPCIGAGFDSSSGDEEPFDRKVGTFDQLFPFGHSYLGHLDLIGRQNMTAANVNLSAWALPEKVKTAVAYHVFWLNANEDALYDAGGGAVRRDPFGDSGTEVGHELDLTVAWNMDKHSKVLFGYSHFWDSDFIQHTGMSENADLFYVQYGFKF